MMKKMMKAVYLSRCSHTLFLKAQISSLVQSRLKQTSYSMLQATKIVTKNTTPASEGTAAKGCQ